MDDIKTVMALAEAAYRKDLTFRRYVDSAVSEAMRHAQHVSEGEMELRDLHHVAVVAAMAVLRLAVEGDRLLKSMEFERDAARKLAEDAALRFPGTLIIRKPAQGIETAEAAETAQPAPSEG